MLQRAASNAYSWWWASHIRTKQSKWLEQNLQDMEEKVQVVLKLIEEDGDSFARRAEMYYKKRPELIHFVQESYRAYRALAERYDHISTELQNANNTIASVFPEQVQFQIDDDDDGPKFPKKALDPSKGNIPKVPQAPKELKRIFSSATKKIQSKQQMQKPNVADVAKSGMSKAKGLKEIGRIQKEILSLQTEKEFVKSSYESGLAKYWDIEQTITEKQEKVCSLQDEFGTGAVIEDDEARSLMTSSALKSCQDTLAQLQQKHEKSAEEAIAEREKLNNARERLKSLKEEFMHGETNQGKPVDENKLLETVEEQKNLDKESSSCSTEEKHDLEMLREKLREQFNVGSNESLSVSELAEKIDELVTTVISLEAAVLSQTALIERLRTESDDLQKQIGSLEDDKASLVDGKIDLTGKLREMEEKLHELQELNRNVEYQNTSLQIHFTETHCSLCTLSEKMHNVKPDEEIEATAEAGWGSVLEAESRGRVKRLEAASKTNSSRDKHKGFGKVQEEIRRKEDELKSDDNNSIVSQKVKQHEALQVSNSLMIEKPTEVNTQPKLKVQGEKLNSEELEILGPSEKGKEVSSEVNSLAELIHPEEKVNDKELKVSDSAQKEEEVTNEVNLLAEIKKQEEDSSIGRCKDSDPTKKEAEFSAEISFQAEPKKQEQLKTEKHEVSDLQTKLELSAEVNLQVELETQDGKLNSEELNVSGRSDEEFSRRESTCDPDTSLEKQQNAKPLGEMEVSGLSNKEKATELKNKDGDIKELDPGTCNTKRSKNENPLQTSNDLKTLLEKCDDQKQEEKVDKQASPKAADDIPPVEKQEQEDEPDWKQMFTNGMENREKTLLTEYTTILRNYKEVKKKLQESENKNKNGDGIFDAMVQLRELKTANAKKDEQIKLLRQKLNLLQIGLADENESDKSTMTDSPNTERKVIYDIRMMMMMMDEPEISPTEKKFRMSIDELLEENLDFWLRFSTNFSQIQKIETEVKDLQSELKKLEERQKKQDGSSTSKYSLISDAKPLYKHLREIHTESSLWLEKSAQLKDELKSRFSSLCEIQEEITAALKESAEDEDFKFTSYQAAKFQGEVLNMKQENHKVADELQAGLDHVTTLQLEVEKTLGKLNDEFKLAGSKNSSGFQLPHSDSRGRVPLRSFIFGIKPKKQKHSIFSCVHPVLQRKYNGLKSGIV